MQPKKDNKYLLILIFLFCFIYPATAVIESIAVKDGWHWTGLLGSAIIILTGYIVTLSIFSNNHINIIKNMVYKRILFSMSFLIPVTTSLMLFYKHTFIFYIITFAVFYTAGCLVYFKDFYDLFNRTVIISGAALIVTALLASMALEKSLGLKGLILWFVYIYIFLILLLLNLDNLDIMLDRLPGGKKHNSKNIIFYNILTVLILFSIIFVLINIKKVVSTLLYLPFIIAGYFILKIRLSKNYDAKEPVLPEDLPKLTSNNSNKWFVIITYIIIILVIIYILYKNSRNFKEAFNKLFSKIINIIKELISRFKIKSDISDINQVYYDEEDFVETHLILGTRDKKPTKINRSIKKLRNLTDPLSKIKYIYGLSLDYLLLNRVNIKKSDTANDIQAKAEEHTGLGYKLKNITHLYKKSRYGSYIPDDKEIKASEMEFINIINSNKKRN